MPSYLITGGTGSLGSTLVRMLLKFTDSQRIVCFSRDEVKQGDLMAELDPTMERLRCFIGDVRDIDRLTQAMHKIDIVIHTAALKRIMQGAYNPFEVIKTNVLGTMNVIEAAIRAGVPQVLFVSTDKAVAPVTLYGTSKHAAEACAIAANAYGFPRGTRISCVRYGNVFGSRGSVVFTWKKALDNGAQIEITDRQMTRFFITLSEAAELVAHASVTMQGGEIFVPCLPTIGMTRLADTMIAMFHKSGPLALKETGLRPGGEKLHEALLSDEEVSRAIFIEQSNMIALLPSFQIWGGARLTGEALPPKFSYTSDAAPYGGVSKERLTDFLAVLFSSRGGS